MSMNGSEKLDQDNPVNESQANEINTSTIECISTETADPIRQGENTTTADEKTANPIHLDENTTTADETADAIHNDVNTTTADETKNPSPCEANDIEDPTSDCSVDFFNDLEGMDVVDSWVDNEEEGEKKQNRDEKNRKPERSQNDRRRRQPSNRTRSRSGERRGRKGGSHSRRTEIIRKERVPERRGERRRSIPRDGSLPRKRRSIAKEDYPDKKGVTQQSAHKEANDEKKNEHRRSIEKTGERRRSIHRDGSLPKRKTPERKNGGERRRSVHREGNISRRKSPEKKNNGERRRSVHRDRSLPRRNAGERRRSVHREGSLRRKSSERKDDSHSRGAQSFNRGEKRDSTDSGKKNQKPKPTGEVMKNSPERKLDEALGQRPEDVKPKIEVVAYPHPSVYKRLHAMNGPQSQETTHQFPFIDPNEPVPPGTEDEFLIAKVAPSNKQEESNSVQMEEVEPDTSQNLIAEQKEEPPRSQNKDRKLEDENKKRDEIFNREIEKARETRIRNITEKEVFPINYSEDKDRNRGMKRKNYGESNPESRSPRRDLERSAHGRSPRRDLERSGRSREKRALSLTRRDTSLYRDRNVRGGSRDRRVRSRSRERLTDRRAQSRSRDIRVSSRYSDRKARSPDRHVRSRSRERRARSRSMDRSRAREPVEVETRIVSYKTDPPVSYERFSSPSLSFELSPVSSIRGRSVSRSPRSRHHRDLSSISLSPDPEYERSKEKRKHHKTPFLKELAEILAKDSAKRNAYSGLPGITYPQPPPAAPAMAMAPPMYGPAPVEMVPYDVQPPQPFVPIDQPPTYPYMEAPPYGPPAYPVPPPVHPDRPALTPIMCQPAVFPAPHAPSVVPMPSVSVDRQGIVERCQQVIQILQADENLIAGGRFTMFPATTKETQGNQQMEQQDLWRSPLCRGSTTFSFTKRPIMKKQLPPPPAPEPEPCKECLERNKKKFVDSGMQTDEVALCSVATQLDLKTYTKEIFPKDERPSINVPSRPSINSLDLPFYDNRLPARAPVNPLDMPYRDSRDSRSPINLPSELLVRDYGHSSSSRTLPASSIYDVTPRSVRVPVDSLYYDREKLPPPALRNLEDLERIRYPSTLPAPKLKSILKPSSIDAYDRPKDIWSRLGPHESSSLQRDSPSSMPVGTSQDLQQLLELVPSQWGNRSVRDYR